MVVAPIGEDKAWPVLRSPMDERRYRWSALYELWRHTEPLAPLRAVYWEQLVEAREQAFPRAAY